MSCGNIPPSSVARPAPNVAVPAGRCLCPSLTVSPAVISPAPPPSLPIPVPYTAANPVAPYDLGLVAVVLEATVVATHGAITQIFHPWVGISLLALLFPDHESNILSYQNLPSV